MTRKNKKFNWIYEGKKNPYEKFLDRILYIVKQENSYRVGAIAYCSIELFDLKYWENRRKNGFSFLKLVEIDKHKTLVLGGKMKLGELMEILDDMDINYEAKKLTQGLDIDEVFTLRRQGKRLYLTPSKKVIKDFIWRQVRHFHTSKVWTVGIMLFKLNTIRRKFFEKFKDTFIPYPQLRKWDNYILKRFDKWMTTKRVKKSQREKTLENLFRFTRKVPIKRLSVKTELQQVSKERSNDLITELIILREGR